MLKIRLPIIQAPMAGNVTSAELIANVSNAGGLGSLGAGYMSPENIRESIHRIRSLTDRPFAVNLFVPNKPHVTAKQITSMTRILKKTCKTLSKDIHPVKPPYTYAFADQLQIVLDEKIPVFSFTFGIPDDTWIKELKRRKIRLIGTATTVSEACLLQQKGIDLIVAQGMEAGGHRGSFLETEENSLIGLFALLPQIADKVNIPVIAAGGIMDARGIIAAMILGASAVQLGTAFITCPEASAHPGYKKALLNSHDSDTTLTRAYSGKLARGLKTRFIEDMRRYQQLILDYPVQHALTRSIRTAAARNNRINYMSLWSGQAASLCRVMHADKLIRTLDREVRKLIKHIPA
jgi:nitronate monooxygenase